MELGIFAKTFVRPTLESVLDAVRHAGFTQIQFNMSSAGLPPLPERIEPETAQRIRTETAKRNIGMAAVSGTFNMIHPDFHVRELGLNRLRNLAASCKAMGTSVITLCTGTRDPENMWRGHPANGDPSAWNDLLRSMETALGIAEEYGVVLGVEPELSNVVDSAGKARKLLDGVRSPYLKIVMDAANLFHPGDPRHMRETMERAFALLGEDIVLAHAKDLGESDFTAAGQGALDYDAYLGLLQEYNYNGPLILHGLDESQIEGSVAFLKQRMVHTQSREAEQ